MHKDYLKSEVDQVIDEDFSDLIKQLETKDFSGKSDKQKVFYKTLKNINERQGVKKMKVIDSVKKVGFVAASVVLVATIGMQTTFAQDLVDKIITKITLKHVSAVQYEASNVKERPVPETLKGKIFDKEGNKVEVFTEDLKEIYTADGERIENFDLDWNIITVAQAEKLRQESHLIVKDEKQLNDYTCFNVILPAYLPEGYVFDRAEFYKDENGVVKDSKYIGLYFTNKETDRSIYMQQRFADEETATELGTDAQVEKVKVNGEDAILTGNRSLDWEAYGNIYYLAAGKTQGGVGKEELIKIAESVKQ